VQTIFYYGRKTAFCIGLLLLFGEAVCGYILVLFQLSLWGFMTYAGKELSTITP
jgi:quinol-cytochrome oxidoreductase complex cytochrome b subunit